VVSAVLWTSIGVWMLATLGWIGLLTAERLLMGATSCEYQGVDSIYGEASWSWAPPGVTCTYDLSIDGRAVEVVEDPPVARIGTAVVLVLWGASNVAFAVAALPRRAAADALELRGSSGG
jgi:hypothetical protein